MSRYATFIAALLSIPGYPCTLAQDAAVPAANYSLVWKTCLRKAIAGLAVGDLDGDGKAEVVASSCYSRELDVLDNLGRVTGTFEMQEYPASPMGGDIIRLADVDGDGVKDILIAKYRDSLISAFNASGRRVLHAFTPGFWIYDFQIAPFGSGGAPQLLLGSDPGLRLQRLDGQVLRDLHAYRWPFALGDLDGDGRPEVVCAVEKGYTVALDTTWNVSMRFPCLAAYIAFSLHVDDVVTDGKGEIICFGMSRGTLQPSMVVGDSKGNMICERSLPGSEWTVVESYCVANFGRDGKKEIVVGTRNGMIYVFDAKGKERWRHYTGKKQIVDGLGVADLDGDGREDLIFPAWDTVYVVTPHLTKGE